MQIRALVMSLLLSTSAAGCGTRNLLQGEFPSSDEGVAFIRVHLSGMEEAKIHIFDQGDRFGPHRSRIDVKAGDAVYAVALRQGKYNIGQISAGLGTDIWKGQSSCPSFDVRRGYNNYIGTIVLSVQYPKYQIRCVGSERGFQDAEVLFQRTYHDLYQRYPTRPAEPKR